MRAVFERSAPDATRFFLIKHRNDSHFEFCWHYHREYELTYITKSRGRRFVGDHMEDYEDGDLVLIGPDLPHTWCSTPPAPGVRHEAVVLQFGADLLGPQGLSGVRLGPVKDMLERSNRGIRFTGETAREVAMRISRLETLPALQQLAELLTILDLLGRSSEGTVLSSRTFVPSMRPDATHPIDRVCQFINAHYLEKIPLSQAARVLAMSPSAFSRYFRKTTGKTYTAYVNQLRIGYACQLLMETERGIADVASASGFHNLSHFNRSFLRAKKMPPREYRNECRRYRTATASA